jgi:hypothetical protein
MSEQPEALRLAGEIEQRMSMDEPVSGALLRDAITELHRLHSVNAELLEAIDALDNLRGPFPPSDADIAAAWAKASAASARARALGQ